MMPVSPFLLESSAAVAQDAVNVLVAGSNPASPAISESADVCTADNAAVANLSPQSPATAADFSALMEIADCRFVLDIARFMSEVEDVPLFLRRAG